MVSSLTLRISIVMPTTPNVVHMSLFTTKDIVGVISTVVIMHQVLSILYKEFDDVRAHAQMKSQYTVLLYCIDNVQIYGCVAIHQLDMILKRHIPPRPGPFAASLQCSGHFKCPLLDCLLIKCIYLK